MSHLVLFIHGLTGDANSFGEFQTLLKEDPELESKVTVDSWNFSTHIFSIPLVITSPRIQDLAQSLSTSLKYREEDTITLVCHSLGGLIARRMILDDFKRSRDSKVRNLLLYATPNEGSGYANIINKFSRSQPQLKQLALKSEFLDELNNDWHFLGMEEKLNIIYIVGSLDSVVEVTSASGFRGNSRVEFIVDGDHLNIVKPRSRDDLRYKILQKTLLDYLKNPDNIGLYREPKVSKLNRELKLNIGDTLPKELNAFAEYSLQTLVGRQDDLKDIEDKFKNNNIVLLRGMGGIGKTTIAKAYLKNYINKYTHVAYVEVTNSIIGDILQSLTILITDFRFDSNISLNVNFNKFIEYLRLIPNTLLVIDGCNNDKELLEIRETLEKLRWHIIITSRCKLESYRKNTIEIGTLSPDLALKLFIDNFGPLKTLEIEIVKRILAKAYYHTKLIILLAKSAFRSPIITLSEIEDLIEKSDYSNEKMNTEVIVDQEEHPVFEFMLKLFNPNTLDIMQKQYLLYFSILPAQEIPAKHIQVLFKSIQPDSVLFNTLNKLTDNGWIDKYGKNYFHIHPLIQLVIKEKLQPTITNCFALVKNLKEELKFTDNKKIDLIRIYLPYAVEIVKSFWLNNDEIIAALCDNISTMFNAFYQSEKALKYNQRSIDIREIIYPEQHINLSYSYGTIAGTYYSLGKYDLSEKYFRKALIIQESKLSPEDPELAVTYSNLSSLYWRSDRSNFSIAFGYINKAITIQKNYLKNNDSKFDVIRLSESYVKLASIYADVSMNKEAILNELKSIVLRRKYLDKDDLRLALSYNNIAITYRELNCYDEAKKYLDLAIDIRERKIPGTIGLAQSYYTLAKLYNVMGLFADALYFANKVEIILVNVVDMSNPFFIDNKKLIESINKKITI